MAMPASDRERARRWTAREVRQLIAESPLQTPRYELVDGELLVTPSPTVPHQRAIAFLWRALDDYLHRNPVGDAYFSPSDVQLETGTIVQSDVFVVPPYESERTMRELPVPMSWWRPKYCRRRAGGTIASPSAVSTAGTCSSTGSWISTHASSPTDHQVARISVRRPARRIGSSSFDRSAE